MSVNVNANGVSPKAGAEPEEEEEAVALSEAGQEGEDQVDGEDVDQTLPPPHLVTQTPPHQRPHHHGHIHQQTCTQTHKHKPHLEAFDLYTSHRFYPHHATWSKLCRYIYLHT